MTLRPQFPLDSQPAPAKAKIVRHGAPRLLWWLSPLILFGTMSCVANQATPSGSPDTQAAATPADAADTSAVTSEEESESTPSAPAITGKVAPTPSELCTSVNPSNTEAAIALTNLQFHRPPVIPFDFDKFNQLDEDEKAVDHLIGCVTNQTDQAMSGVNLQIEYRTQSGSGFASAGIDFPGTAIAPGKTVPFIHRTELETDTTELTITEVSALEPMPGHEDYAFQTFATFQPQIVIAYQPAQAQPSESVTGFCDNVDAPASEAEIAVDNLKIYDLPQDAYDFREEPGAILVGCVTNLTAEPLEGLGVAYGGENGSVGGATLSFPGETIQPGQTVPFRKFGDLSPGTEAIFIHNVGDVEVKSLVTRQGVAEGN